MADLDVQGHCYCGTIQFRIRIPEGQSPIFTAYCHCDSCRRAHAAPLYHVACLDAEWFEITAGADSLQDFIKEGSRINRAFCGRCGTRVLNRFPGWKHQGRTPLVVFPNLLDEATQRDLPELLRPRKHNCPEETVLDGPMLAPMCGG
ncbi:MAG: hypothetical protein ACI9WU_005499 [Myxococcota bacterium]|jgi:hypothetical protein